MTNASSLYGAAAELLAKAVSILAGTPGGAPANQYVSHGPPAYDCCSTVTVHVGQLNMGPFRRGAEGTTIFDPLQTNVVPTVPLVITALRCASAQPQGGMQISLPAAAKIAEDAALVYADGWSLFIGVNKAFRDNTLFSGFPCRPFQVDPAIPISPEGGCLGWAISLQVALDGFDPPGT